MVIDRGLDAAVYTKKGIGIRFVSKLTLGFRSLFCLFRKPTEQSSADCRVSTAANIHARPVSLLLSLTQRK